MKLNCFIKTVLLNSLSSTVFFNCFIKMFQLLQIRFIVIVEKNGMNKTVACANILTVSWFEYKIKKKLTYILGTLA